MNIVLAYEAHFYRGSGGIYTDTIHAYDYWRRFLRVFDSVTVVARVSDAPQANSVRSDGPGVQFHALPWYRGPSALVRQLPRIVSEVRHAVDLHADSAFIIRGPGGVATLLWQELLRRRLPYGLQVVADAWETLRGTSLIGHNVRPAMALLQWLQVRGACALTYATQAALQRRYPPPPGIPHLSVSDVELPDQLFHCAPVPIRDTRSGLKVVFVGSLHQRYKGLDLLLRAAAKNVSAQITVVGDGPFRSEYEQLATQLGLSARTHFLGGIPGGSPVFEVLRHQDLFVLPSRAEGLPRAMLEAMAVGLPCIGTRVGGIPEILDVKDTVPPNDVAALVAKLEELADPDRRREAARRNRHVAAEYRVAARDAKLRQFYDQVIDYRVENKAGHRLRPRS